MNLFRSAKILSPTVKASALLELPRFLERLGVEIGPLLDEVGLARTMLRDQTAGLPLDSVIRLFERAAARTSAASLGLHYGLSVQPGATGLLGQIVITAPTVRRAFEALATYLPLYVTAAAAEFRETSECGILSWALLPGFGDNATQFIDFGATLIVGRIRSALGANWRPLEMKFAHPRPARLEDYTRLFGPKLVFDAPRNELIVKRSALDAKMPQVAIGLFDTVRIVGDRALAEVSDTNSLDDPPALIEASKAALSKLLEADDPFDLAALAQHLNLSPRALQYRLERAGTTYERLLSLTRQTLARRYICESDLPMSDIAGRLRFSEQSAFTRAVHKWFGAAPTTLRHDHRR